MTQRGERRSRRVEGRGVERGGDPHPQRGPVGLDPFVDDQEISGLERVQLPGAGQCRAQSHPRCVDDAKAQRFSFRAVGQLELSAAADSELRSPLQHNGVPAHAHHRQRDAVTHRVFGRWAEERPVLLVRLVAKHRVLGEAVAQENGPGRGKDVGG